VLLPQLLDDLRSRRGLVAEHTPAGPVHEGVDHVVRKAVRVGREGLRRNDAHQLPVARRRVLSLRPLDEPARHGGCAGLRGATLERLHVAEAERLEARQVQSSDCSGDVAQGVRALVAVLCGVRQLAGSDRVEHDDARPGHPAILGTPVSNALGLLAFVAYVLAVVGVAAGVTWVVVRLTPEKKPGGQARS
jgi:hypothetical protein